MSSQPEESMKGMSEHNILLQTRHLWKTCFGDSEAFMDIYFSKKYTPASNIVRQADGTVVAATQLLPYVLGMYGKAMPVGYISGLATLPAYRGKGYASRILHEAHHRLADTGALLSFLIPGNEALRAYYRAPRNGAYETVAYRQVAKPDLGKATLEDLECQPVTDNAEAYYEFFLNRLREETSFLQPSPSDFSAAMDLCRLEQGQVWIAHSQGQTVGWAMLVPESEKHWTLRDIRCTTPTVAASLLRKAQCTLGSDIVIVQKKAVPSHHAEAQPYAMARVINVPQFLQQLAQWNPEWETIIEVVSDEAFPQNNGRYALAQGTCHTTQMPPAKVFTPGQLAAFALSECSLNMPLMLDE